MEVFFSYAHEDEALRDKLAKYLKLLEWQGVIRAWHDRDITAGEEWKDAIDNHSNLPTLFCCWSALTLVMDCCGWVKQGQQEGSLQN
jgi:TIR domain